MTSPAKSWSHRFFEAAVVVFAAALLLSWAWELLMPLLPLLAFVVLVYGFLRWRTH